MLSSSRALPLLNLPASLRPVIAARLYATQTDLGTTSNGTNPRRKKVTMLNDDGRVSWGNLTAREKAARTTQQTFNFGFILLGAVLTVRLFKDYIIQHLLTAVREGLHISCIPRSSHWTVKQHISTERSIRSRQNRDV
jgi:hypothetical protein